MLSRRRFLNHSLKSVFSLYPKAFADHLGSRITFGARVTRVVNQRDGVRVSFVKNGSVNEILGDSVICTIPIPMMKDLEFEPALPDLKAEAIQNVLMRSVTRINLQFKNRFWNHEEGLKGLLVSHTDTPIERLWDLTSTQAGDTGILTCYVQGSNADDLDRFKTDAEVFRFALDEISKFFPQAPREFMQGFVWRWKNQPWVKGGWAAYGRGHLRYFQALQMPHGNVFFAGDHTSVYNGWAQGAFESAHLAVSEVIQATARSGEESLIRSSVQATPLVQNLLNV